jgi:hypothetical protein
MCFRFDITTELAHPRCESRARSGAQEKAERSRRLLLPWIVQCGCRAIRELSIAGTGDAELTVDTDDGPVRVTVLPQAVSRLSGAYRPTASADPPLLGEHPSFL